jgi:hypothetical protein
MTLRELQSEFAANIPKLIEHAILCGYEVTLGDAYRDPRVHGDLGTKLGYGAANSNHKNRLAIDLNLFKDGVFLDGTDAHRLLGDWWEHQHPLARWGGRFNDGNHYSFEWKGMK